MSVLKDIWKNQKYRSIIILIFWFIFIGILIISFNGKTTYQEEEKDDTFDLKNLNSYEFTYSTSDSVFNGVYYNGKYLLYLNNEKYYKNNFLYNLKDNSIIEEPFVLKIDSKFISSLIKDIEPILNNDYSTYLIPLTSFMKKLGENTNLSYNIILNVYKNKINMDLTNYYKAKGANVDSYILTVNYYNINNISDFTKEYDLMIGEK